MVDNIIDFSDTNLKALNDVTRIYIDGTFKSCTKYFLQFFTIHGLYVQLVFLILPNKILEMYIKAFQYIMSYWRYCSKTAIHMSIVTFGQNQ